MPLHVLTSPDHPACFRPIASQEELQWMAEQDLKRALRIGGVNCPAAQAAARNLCRVHGVDPDQVTDRFVPHSPMRIGRMEADEKPYLPVVEIRAWQMVQHEMARWNR